MSSDNRVYDYRIREPVVRTGNPDLYPHLQIPRGTALTWLRRGMPDVVWLDTPDDENTRLRERVARLEGRVAMLTALLRLVLTVLRISGLQLGRITSTAHRESLLRALEHATKVMFMRAALRVLGHLVVARGRVEARADAVRTHVPIELSHARSSTLVREGEAEHQRYGAVDC